MFLDSLRYFSFMPSFIGEQVCWSKCFTDTFSTEKRTFQNFLDSQGVLFEWWPQFLQWPFILNCPQLIFLNSIRYGQVSLWHSKETRQVVTYRSPLKLFLFRSLKSPMSPIFIWIKTFLGADWFKNRIAIDIKWELVLSTYILPLLVCPAGPSTLFFLFFVQLHLRLIVFLYLFRQEIPPDQGRTRLLM